MSSASQPGAIPGFAVVDSGGSTWVKGIAQATSNITAVTSSVLLNGATAPLADAKIIQGTQLADLFSRPDLTAINLSSLELKLDMSGTACNATYQVAVKVEAGTWSVSDTADFLWEYGADCP
jgi:hypothetical protein